MPDYSPEYIAETIAYSSGQVVTADEINTVLNKIIHQGDFNSAWLAYLQNTKIPQAVSGIDTSALTTQLLNSMTNEVNAMLSAATSKTTGWFDKRKAVIIDISADTVPTDSANDALKITKWYIPSQGRAYAHGVFNAYSGAVITSLTAEQRVTDGDNLSDYLAANSLAYSVQELPLVYQNKSSAVDQTYLVGSYYGYLYNTSNTVKLKDIDYSGNYPVIYCQNSNAVTVAINGTTISDMVIIACPFSSFDSTERAAIKSAINAASIETMWLSDYIAEFENTLYRRIGVNRYCTSEGNKVDANNLRLASNSQLIGFGDVKINVADLMKKSIDALTFTVNGTTLTVTKADGTAVCTYSVPTIDNTLVGALSATTQLTLLGVSSTGTTATSKAASGVTATNGALACTSLNASSAVTVDDDPVIVFKSFSNGVLTIDY